MINIKIIESESRYCDYCRENKNKFVNNDDRDICFDCVLEIYELAKNEILN